MNHTTDYRYAVRLERQREGGYSVSFPAVEAICTQCDSIDEALDAARDALDEYLAFCIVEGKGIPVDRSRRAAHWIEPSPYLVLKAALYEAIRGSGESRSRVARRLGVAEGELRRMLDPRHPTKFQRIADALELLGARVRIVIEPLRDEAA